MMNRLICAFILVTAVPVAAPAGGLPPLLVGGPPCGECPRRETIIVFEDLDGRGGYDFVTTFGCGGDIRGGRWDPTAVNPPGGINAGGFIGRLPPCAAGATYVFASLYDRSSRMYTWQLTEMIPGIGPEGEQGIVVASLARDAAGTLSVCVTAECSAAGGHIK